MKAVLTVTKMCGGGTSFEVLVPVSEVNKNDHNYFIHQDSKEYVPLYYAIEPEEIKTMPKGWEKYERFMEWKKQCAIIAAGVVNKYFPEVDSTKPLNELWYPNINVEKHQEIEVVL